jgi:hypothetical protein
LNLDGLRWCFWQALAEVLQGNSSITNINLEHNNISAEGAKAWRVWFGGCTLHDAKSLTVAKS